MMTRLFFPQPPDLFSLLKKNDKFAKRLAHGILVSLKLASVTEMSKALDLNRTTVLRNFNIYIERRDLKALLIIGQIVVLTNSIKRNSRLSNALWIKGPHSKSLLLKLGSAMVASAGL